MTGRRILAIDDWPGVDPLSCQGAGLGSSLFKLTALNDLAQSGHEVGLLTSPEKRTLLAGTPAVTTLLTTQERFDADLWDVVISLGLPGTMAKALPRRVVPFTADDRIRYKHRPHVAFWREFVARSCGLPVPSHPARCPLPPLDEGDSDGRPRRVIVASDNETRLKSYLRWPEVIEGLLAADSEWEIVLVGRQAWRGGAWPRVLDMTTRTGLKDLRRLVQGGSVVVGVDGLVTNLALWEGVPAAVLFSFIRPEQVIDDSQKNRSPYRALVNSGCPHQFCYPLISNYRTSSCRWMEEHPGRLRPDCLEIPPDEVLGAVLELLE